MMDYDDLWNMGFSHEFNQAFVDFNEEHLGIAYTMFAVWCGASV